MESKLINWTIVIQTIMVALILYVFREPIAKLLDILFVSHLFSKLDNDWITLASVLVIGVLLLIKVKNMNILADHLPLGFFIISFYLIQRFNPFWRFYAVEKFPNLYLFDLVVGVIILAYLKDLKFRKIVHKEPKNTSIWEEDIPVENKDQDTFQRRHYAAALATQIEKMYSKRSFAIGILGEYGSGKTSFINLIKSNLKEDNIEVIEFNAWKSDKAENIQTDFFNHLAGDLNEKQRNLAGLLTSYSNKLSKMDDSLDKLFRRIGILHKLINPVKSEADDYEKINKILKNSQRKLVIIIDDMDRLYSDEVIEVLRLVRNTANFTNTTYLLAYEKGYIQKAIKEELHIDSSTPYMDKIVQMEIPLPKREQHNLIDLLKELLQKQLTKEELMLLERTPFFHGFNYDLEAGFNDLFRNARDVIKFINSFLISHSLLKNEIVFDKLFLIELLKYRFPIFYERLYQYRYEFLQIVVQKQNFNRHYQLRKVNQDSNGSTKQYAFISDLKRENTSNDDINIIKILLEALFDNTDDKIQDSKSIIYPLGFERYFRFRLSANDLPENEFQEAWKGGLPTLSEFIFECNKRNLLRHLMERLFKIRPKNLIEFEMLIKSLFMLGPLYERRKYKYAFDIEALLELLADEERKIVRKIYRGDISKYMDLLNNIFIKAPMPFIFHSFVIYKLNSEGKSVPLTQYQLMDYQILYLKDYVRANGLDDKAMWLMSIIGVTSVKNKSLEITDEVKALVKGYLENYDPLIFLKSSIQTLTSSNKYKFDKELIKFFDEPDDFRRFVYESEKIDPNIKQEYLDFFDRAKVNNFDSSLHFDFQTDLRPNDSNDSRN